MKKILYTNIISIIIFFLIPWFYLENSDTLNWKISLDVLSNILLLIGVIFLFAKNVLFIRSTKGKEKIVPIFFIIFPIVIALLFIYGKFFIFLNYKGL